MIIASSLALALLLALVAALLHSRRLYARVIAGTQVREQLMRALADQTRSRAATAAKFDAFLQATADAMLSVDAQGGCRLLNLPARELFGDPSTLPQTLLSVTQCAELSELVKSSGLRAPDADPVRGEVALHAFGGKIMQALVFQSTPADTASSSRDQMILLRDVTNLRRLETMRRDFVANVSHELRTPLSSVMAMTETLLDGALDDEAAAKHFLRTIMRETDRLVRLTADLLDLSGAETRQLVKSKVDLAVLVRDIVSRLSSQVAKAEINLAVDAPEHLFVECDEDEISQVLLNLIENAVKYTPRGGSVTVTAQDGAAQVKVEVADTGIGILQHDLPRLFERFYRADKARSRQSGGTGLGLSIVKHIVERHGGSLWVRSEYNHGSLFGFLLPKADHDAAKLIDGLGHAEGEYLIVVPLPASNSTDVCESVPPLPAAR